MGAMPIAKISEQEYLAMDRVAEVPSEYHDGEMYPMVAVSWAHAVIAGNVAGLLRDRLVNSPCKLAIAPLRVRASKKNYVLPDFVVVCGKPVLADEHQDTLLNPKVVIEILSPTTADYDYGRKFLLYQQIQSFEEYLLVAQDQARIDVYRKTGDKRWIITTYKDLDAVAAIESLGISIPLAEIYSGVDFPAAAD